MNYSLVHRGHQPLIPEPKLATRSPHRLFDNSQLILDSTMDRLQRNTVYTEL